MSEKQQQGQGQGQGQQHSVQQHSVQQHSVQQQTFPVVAEVWSIFENTLQIQAKKLVDDIAKREKADPKVLWARIKPQIRIGLLDIEIPESGALCTYPSTTSEGAVKQLCRSPCLLGFDACTRHVHTSKTIDNTSTYPTVDRITDCHGHTYFVDTNSIVRDKNGKVKGHILEGVLYLYEE